MGRQLIGVRLAGLGIVWAMVWSAQATERHVPGEYGTIQGAIDACVAGDVVVVGSGTYTGTGNKNLQLRKTITVRSASGAASCIIDCQHDGRGFYIDGEATAASVVDGFTIRNGYTEDRAGGLYCSSTATVVNCILTGNVSAMGGGAYLTGYAKMRDCVITGNSALYEFPEGLGGGGIAGAGFYVTNCTITGNWARFGGGTAGGGIFVNCAISGNVAEVAGGGIYRGGAELANCVITGNTAGWYGGGVCTVGDWVQLFNCTLSSNAAGWYGGGMYCYDHGGAVIENSVFSENSATYGPEIALDDQTRADVSYSDIHGDQPVFVWGLSYVDWGSGNVNADPGFVDPNGGNYRLQLQSPCIDAGSNALVAPDFSDLDHDGEIAEPVLFDLAGNMRVARFTVDMGAYEVPFGDMDCDGVVSFADINPFVAALGGRAGYEAQNPNCVWGYADTSGDGVVSFADINPFVRMLAGP